MKRIWKLLLGFVLVSFLSAGVAVGVYSYLNQGESQQFSGLFDQSGFSTVRYATAAENTDFTYAAEQSVNAVVHIKSVAKPSQREGGGQRSFDPFEFFFGQGPQRQVPRERVGFGSGVILSTDGYIVTNHHVIAGADEIEVTMNDDKIFPAKLIGGDEASDIALLKIEGKDLPVIPFGDSDLLKIGEWVLAVGNPFNLKSTVTAGIVSATGRANLFAQSRNPYDRSNQYQANAEKIQSFIQTDAAVNPGNSGGALVNTKGELVGINTMIYSETGNFVGYSFAVPVNLVKKVVADLKQYGVVQRAMIGVSILDMDALKETDPDAYNKLKIHEGVYVAGFSSNSSAKSAGLEVGDVITAINKNKIRNFSELRAQLSLYSPGNKVDVQVQRGDKVKSYTVELKNDQGTTAAIKNRSYEEILGAKFNELSPELKSKAGINYGLEVTKISNGKLKQLGIKNGFIILTANDNRLSKPSDLEEIVSATLKQDPDDRGLFIKGFYPSGKIEYYALDLNE
jgi:Trypsin-like serine proteases, typically periplasmic, contain C-terminal PDZ domain